MNKADNKQRKLPDDAISVNIWDDYIEDEFVPSGQIQETFVCIEELGWTWEQLKELCDFLVPVLQASSAGQAGATFASVPKWVSEDYGGEKYYRINVKGLTHVLREQLERELVAAKLEYQGHRLHIYSES